MTNIVLFAILVVDGPAQVAVLLPGLRVDPPVLVERNHNVVALQIATLGMPRFTRQT